ncbi:GNAT family N-acetyltransferase [Oceanobacillus jeddahense]|uniref:GNAT family N-acetyltransferase n=1 Tax=Oceanobacillus jeddahense TaxID=1462527 RepID=A0ABY5K048_9BACI|nr:GNAT family N-acetyltransferase [Oceanobacillus jeddahense]UUI04676.1 GNAT family N-acetyltransferase [Oceanobacillus jeddahense]
MNPIIRQLLPSDKNLMENMYTGIEDDYIIRIFDKLCTGNHVLFGLFIDNQLVSTAGYSLFSSHYAMLGRLRSDLRYQGNGYSKQLTEYIRDQAFQAEDLDWVGANTQKHNIPAQNVLSSICLEKQAILYGCAAKMLDGLSDIENVWPEITHLEEKQELLDTYHVKANTIFPIECYYPFPSSPRLFQEEQINSWRFFQEDGLPPLITKKDIKKETYLHAIYPHKDLFQRPGLWKTIAKAQNELQIACPDEEVHVWIDIPASLIDQLPADHPFELDSPWFLYGMDRAEWEKLS